jgi:predicted nucleic acid-binding protein
MILYLDSSALVKFYLEEHGSTEVQNAYRHAQLAGTATISRAEVSAGLARAHRMNLIPEQDAHRARMLFHEEWPEIVHVMVSETLVARADSLAWEQGLRGYDAVHLAAALLWQESVGIPISLATFDEQLWKAAGNSGLDRWPENLAPYLSV